MAEKQRAAAALEGEIAEVCGVLNSATGRLVSLIAKALATGCWEGWGIRSAEHWVAWQCGVSPGRARTLVAMPAGELSEDQVAVGCHKAPAQIDAEVAELAGEATGERLDPRWISFNECG